MKFPKPFRNQKEYGKVSDLLGKQAAQQMKSGDKPNASQSLADAAKELKDLIQQMNDAASMMAALENLEQASMCVGGVKAEAPMQETRQRSGKNPGNGVGTWGEEAENGAENFGEEHALCRSFGPEQSRPNRQRPIRARTIGPDRPPITHKSEGPDFARRPDAQHHLERPKHQGHEQGSIRGSHRHRPSRRPKRSQRDKVPAPTKAPVKDYFDDFKK